MTCEEALRPVVQALLGDVVIVQDLAAARGVRGERRRRAARW